MLIKIDKHSSLEFITQGINDINVDIVTAGCAGSKISVVPRILPDKRIPSETHNGIVIWVFPEHAEMLDGSQIARAKGKYYLVSQKVQSRCGCGSSFSFEKKLISTNLVKIHRLQNALRLSSEVQNMQKILKKPV